MSDSILPLLLETPAKRRRVEKLPGAVVVPVLPTVPAVTQPTPVVPPPTFLRKLTNGSVAFHEDGFPVIRFAYDKFINVRLNKTDDGNVHSFVIGEWKMLPDHSAWEKTMKFITLNLRQFNVLCGLLILGKTDLPEDSGELTTRFNLGDSIYFSWNRWNRANVATIRTWTVLPNGDQVPTKRGISFGAAGYKTLKEVLFSGVVHKEAATLDAGVNRDGINYPFLREETRKKLWDYLHQEEAKKCWACTSGEGPHSCKLNPKMAPFTVVDWKQAENSLKANKWLEGFLLLRNRLSPKQLLEFDAAKYLADNSAFLCSTDTPM